MRMNRSNLFVKKLADSVIELGLSFFRDGGTWIKGELELVEECRQFG